MAMAGRNKAGMGIIVTGLVTTLALGGCGMLGGGDDYVPTAADIQAAGDNAQRPSQGTQATGGGTQGQGGAGANSGNQQPATTSNLPQSTSADGNWSTDDFFGSSGIYGTDIAKSTNSFAIDKDAVGRWNLVAILDTEGQVWSGTDIGITELLITEEEGGTLTVDGQISPIHWTMYRDFPQVAMGVINDSYIVTMEMNDRGMLTMKQDVDGQMMLFSKVQ